MNDTPKENLHDKYGLIELIRGKYFDSKLEKNLIIKQNYVEASGDDFQKQFISMILYVYEGGKNRTELASVFAEYAEENLELIERTDQQLGFRMNDDSILTTGEIVQPPKELDNAPAILDAEQREFRQ